MLLEISAKAAEILEDDGAIRRLAARIAEARDVLYLGRGACFPIALEGALKLKEISYIRAEGYAAGKMRAFERGLTTIRDSAGGLSALLFSTRTVVLGS